MSSITDILNPVGLGVSVVGNIGGGIATGAINKERQKNLDTEKANSNALFNKQYYQDELKRSENASFLKTLRDRYKSMGDRSARSAAITGATPEAQLAQTQVEATGYGDAVNRMASMASQRKDAALNAQQQRRMMFYGLQDNIDQSKIASWQNFMTNANELFKGSASNIATANETPDLQKLGSGAIKSIG